MSKKDGRLENKKRKAAAFLELIGHETEKKKGKIEDESGVQSLVTCRDEENRAVLVQQKDESLSDQMLEEYKKVYRERRKANMQMPKVFLTLDELARYHPYHVDDNGVSVTPPIFMTDVQHLLLFAVLNDYSSFIPRWCRLMRVGRVTKVVAVVLDSLSDEEFRKYPESLPTLHQAFDLTTVLVPPSQYGSSVREDLMNVPIRLTQLMNDANLAGAKLDKKTRKKKEVSVIHLKQKWAMYKAVRNLMTNPLQATTIAPTPDSVNVADRKDSVQPLTDDGISCEQKHPVNCNDNARSETDDLKSERTKLSSEKSNDNDSKLKENDCDRTSLDKIPDDGNHCDGSGENVPGDEGDEVVTTFKQDKFDRRWLMLNSAQMIMENIPSPAGSSYRSFQGFEYTKHEYKQVTEKSPMYALDCEMIQTRASRMDLARVSIVDENLEVVLDTYVKPRAPVIDYVTRFSGITKKILDPVKTRLEDVQALVQARLPADAILCGQSIGGDLNSLKLFHPYLIDTSVIYNLTGTKAKTGLKALTNIFLKRTIQNNHMEGHCSVEDAMATMELVLLKLRKAMDFGDIKLNPLPTKSPPEPVKSEVKAEPTTRNTNKPESKTEPNTSNKNQPEIKTLPNTNNKNQPEIKTLPNTSNKNQPEIKTEPNTSNKKQPEIKTLPNTSNKNQPEIKTLPNTSNKKQPEIKTLPNTSNKNQPEIKTEPNMGEPSNKPSVSDSTAKPSDSGAKSVIGNDASVSESLTKTLLPGTLSADMKRKRLFFQQEGKMFMESFIHKLAKHEKQGTIVDEAETRDLYPSSVPVVTCGSDKESERQTLANIHGDSMFCLSHLYGYRNYLRDSGDSQDEEELKKCLWKLDRRFWKIMLGLPKCSLFVVILPGRRAENGVLYEARTFAKIIT